MPDQDFPHEPTDQAPAPSRITRRSIGVLAGTLLVGGALFASNWYNITAEAAGEGRVTVGDAHEGATSGAFTLIDIRRPDEWKRTGVGEGAYPIDMRREDFTTQLLGVTDGDKSAPVALICARGVRSRRLTERLTAAGFTNIIDVPEGMLGSGAGPGWIKSGLPTVAFDG